MTEVIEFYTSSNDLLARVNSSIVPPVSSMINIRGKTWKVKAVSYALDHSDEPSLCRMRANVDLVKP